MARQALVQLWTPPSLPFPLPACWEWNEGDPLPEGVTFVKGDEAVPMHFKLCLASVSPPKLTIEKTNIKEIDVDVKGCLKWTFKRMALPEAEAESKMDECVRYVKTVCNRFDVEVTSDLPEEKFCFALPTEWRFKGVLKNNVPIPFNIVDTNKVCFTVTHSSPTTITFELASDMSQMVETTTSMMVYVVILIIIVSVLFSIMTSLRVRLT